MAFETSPKYVAVADKLEQFVSGLPPHSLMPTEQQLSRRFGVSRVTVRAALDLLEKNGLVSRERGRGTIVSPPKVLRHLAPFVSFEKDMSSQGIAFGTEVLAYDNDAVPPELVREHLGLQQPERVGRLSLVRRVEDKIVSHELHFYPSAVSRSIDARRMETEEALAVLEDAVGRKVRISQWESEIRAASRESAEALGISSRVLVLENSYTWLSDDMVPVEAGLVTYRVDRCKFRYDTKFLNSNGG